MLSLAVMAHRKRQAFVDELLPQLPGATVVWDERNDRWDTGRRSLLAHDDTADWHVVVQDDAILCRDFLPGIAVALEHAPSAPVSFYVGACRPHGPAVAQAVQNAKAAGKSFLAMTGPLWGVAIAIPVPFIGELVADCDKRTGIANYDMRMAAHFALRAIDCWYTLPSLVNHRVGFENPSLVPGRGASAGRVAHDWIGDRSALDIDWSRSAHKATEFHSSRRTSTRRRVPVAQVPKRTIIDRGGVRRRIRADSRIPAGLALQAKGATPADRRAVAGRKKR